VDDVLTPPTLERNSSMLLYRSMQDNLSRPDLSQRGSARFDPVGTPTPTSPTAMRGWTTEDLTERIIAHRSLNVLSWPAGALHKLERTHKLALKSFRDLTVARFQQEVLGRVHDADGAWRWKGLFYFFLAILAKTFNVFFVTLPVSARQPPRPAPRPAPPRVAPPRGGSRAAAARARRQDLLSALIPLSDFAFSFFALYTFIQVSAPRPWPGLAPVVSDERERERERKREGEKERE